MENDPELPFEEGEFDDDEFEESIETEYLSFNESGEPFFGANIGGEKIVFNRYNTTVFTHINVGDEGADNIKVNTGDPEKGTLVLFRQAFNVRDDDGNIIGNTFDQITDEMGMAGFDMVERPEPHQFDLDYLFQLNLTNETINDFKDESINNFIETEPENEIQELPEEEIDTTDLDDDNIEQFVMNTMFDSKIWKDYKGRFEI